jgi:hypothetical protein
MVEYIGVYDHIFKMQLVLSIVKSFSSQHSETIKNVTQILLPLSTRTNPRSCFPFKHCKEKSQEITHGIRCDIKNSNHPTNNQQLKVEVYLE